METVIKVDRSVKPDYPDGVRKILHPELELSGPQQYDLLKIKQWLHPNQEYGPVYGNTIYKYLQRANAIADCLNFQDGIAIQEKGLDVFLKLFPGRKVFLWASVVENNEGFLVAPYLVRDNGGVAMKWLCLEYRWDSLTPALRFKN